jgi:hypothetical protein
MLVELDHVFVCTAVGAPEGEELVRFGLREGPANRHEGQGTANRRFSFRNAMLELVWVYDENEARNEATRRTLLWERWAGRNGTSNPFGICVRPGRGEKGTSAFSGWEYRPTYLPSPLSMEIGEGGLEEPMWVYLGFLSRAQREQHFAEHSSGVREITGLVLTSTAPLQSEASRVVREAKVLAARMGSEPLLEIEFDGGVRGRVEDFRPRLPVVFRF